jgi:hypothetical protein
MELKDLHAEIDATQSLTGSDEEGPSRKRSREVTVRNGMESDGQSDKRARRET